MINRKKGQTGTNAAILIFLIAVLIIVYIIFLPESEKQLIFEGNDSNGEVKSGAEKARTLLREFPGTISSVFGVEDEKRLPNVFLLERKDATELVRINPFIVSASSFSEKIKTEEFNLDNVENIENVVLTFETTNEEGVLTIKLNNRIIFENEIIGSADPVRINKNDLGSSNVLEFSVDKPGAAFWVNNKYSLENVRIIGDISDKSQQESRNLFVLTDEEFDNLEKAALIFIPYCSSVNNVGRLDILINDREIYSSIPVCEDPYKQVIPTSTLNRGDNTVVFKTNRGSYSVEQISAEFEFKESRNPPHYFELTDNEFEDINDSRKDLVLTLEFVDDDEIKDLTVNINGHRRNVDTRDSTFTTNINVNNTQEGNNYIRLTPEREEVGIVEMKIELIRR